MGSGVLPQPVTPGGFGFRDSDGAIRLIFMLSADEITKLHDRLTNQWHQQDAKGDASGGNDWLNQVAGQHRANFDLWHIEDEARKPGATDADLADVKRRIDGTNQLRNDLAEELDRALLEW